ncbi:hypothetical protein TWF730_009613 [Orbilia blumenaviensis]|uniref:Uncharacterized protein n=1 Tax=Orbilia blumenaviensis TaxID=1796055 RepID=A0AAV9USL0_9PEZI
MPPCDSSQSSESSSARRPASPPAPPPPPPPPQSQQRTTFALSRPENPRENKRTIPKSPYPTDPPKKPSFCQRLGACLASSCDTYVEHTARVQDMHDRKPSKSESNPRYNR